MDDRPQRVGGGTREQLRGRALSGRARLVGRDRCGAWAHGRGQGRAHAGPGTGHANVTRAGYERELGRE